MDNFREFLFKSGDVFLPKNIRNILETNLIGSNEKTFYITYWSIIHFISGILIGYLYLNFNQNNYFINMFIIHTIWEIWQILIGMNKPLQLTGNNNIIDIIVDTVLFMIGSYIIKILYKYLH